MKCQLIPLLIQKNLKKKTGRCPASLVALNYKL